MSNITSIHKHFPWDDPRWFDKLPSLRTLHKWRRLKRAYAMLAGADWACDLCGLPGKGKSAYVKLWWSDPLERRLCYGCYIELDVAIKKMEAKSQNVHRPVTEIEALEAR